MNTSKSESNRQVGKHQLEEQRESILDAAAQLFLKNGLENTRMIDIAAQAGITKVTLYRYFPNRDVIALEVHARMWNRIAAQVGEEAQELSPAGARRLARAMIRNFPALRDAYRYMGMFDRIYLDNPLDAARAQWTKDRFLSIAQRGTAAETLAHKDPQAHRLLTVLSAVLWFLEKLALRGELTWSDQAIPLEAHLQVFEEMIMGYLDRLSEVEAINQHR